MPFSIVKLIIPTHKGLAGALFSGLGNLITQFEILNIESFYLAAVWLVGFGNDCCKSISWILKSCYESRDICKSLLIICNYKFRLTSAI